MNPKHTILLCLLAAAVSAFAAGSSAVAGSERIVVHTDRNVYVSGERVFYKIEVLDGISGRPSALSRIAYLVLRGSGNEKVAQISIRLDGGMAYSSIPLPDTLASGVYQLLAYTNWMKNSDEPFGSKALIVANLFDQKPDFARPGNPPETNAGAEIPSVSGLLSITSGRSLYAPGETVQLLITLNGDAGPEPAKLLVAVSQESPFDFGAVNPALQSTANAADRTKFKNPGLRFYPETDGQILQGRVAETGSNTPAAGKCVLLSARDTCVNLQYAYTGPDGTFRFRLNDYYQGKMLALKLKDPDPRNGLKITTDDKFELPGLYTPPSLVLNASQLDYLRKSQDIVKVQRSYGLLPETKLQPAGGLRFYSPELYYQPDYEIYPADYEPLADFSEIDLELLPSVRIRKNRSEQAIEMIDPVNQGILRGSPAIFLDGIYQYSMGAIASMGSGKIRRIEVLNQYRVCGSLNFEGILAVFSADPAIESAQPGASSFAADILESCSLMAPAKQVAGSAHDPDFRQLLYWNPVTEIKPGRSAAVEFRTSQLRGNYVVWVTGYTPSGKAVEASYRFSVK